MTKRSEIGIGQRDFSGHLNDIVDYVDPMFVNEYVFVTARARETFSYETIIRPYDKYVWAFTLASTTIILATILMLAKFDNFTKRLQDFSGNKVFEGQKFAQDAPIVKVVKLSFQDF